MGNRAVIAFGSSVNSLGIYLHWNGGAESVLAFLEAAKQLGVDDPIKVTGPGVARLVQIIANFFGGTLSVGVGTLKNLDRDNGDNGEYEVGPGFTIIARRFNCGDNAMRADDLTAQQREKYEGILAECLTFRRRIEAQDDLLVALDRAESFIAAFEDDELSEGIDELLAQIRAARDKARAA